MTRLISKQTACQYKQQKNKMSVALSLVYAMKNKGRLTKNEFETLEKATRTGQLYYNKKLKGLFR